MKWFQLDSDTPADPKVARLIHDGLSVDAGGNAGHAAFGAMMLLCCFVADHGRGAPGYAVDESGRPLDMGDMAFAAKFGSVDRLEAFLDVLADRRLIDADRWRSEHVVILPAMFHRADEYTRRKWVKDGTTHEVVVSSPAKVEKRRSTKQDKTVQDTTKPGGAQGALLDLFCACHVERLKTRYVVSRPKDLTLLAKLAKSREGETPSAEALVRAFFATSDPFIVRAGFSVGVLFSQVPKLITAIREPRGAAPTKPARVGVARVNGDKYRGIGE